jgi:YgiT-type zinc finger domain-containing protein
MEWATTTFEYSQGGVTVRVPGVPAWVCPHGDDVSFTPEVTDQLILTVRELVEAAKRAQQRRPQFRQYIVQVSAS